MASKAPTAAWNLWQCRPKTMNISSYEWLIVVVNSSDYTCVYIYIFIHYIYIYTQSDCIIMVNSGLMGKTLLEIIMGSGSIVIHGGS